MSVRISRNNSIEKWKGFPINVRDIHKVEKKNSIAISVFGYEIKEKHQIYVSRKNVVKKTCQLVIDRRNWQKSITFSIIIRCSENTMEENMFFVNVHKPSVQKKY